VGKFRSRWFGLGLVIGGVLLISYVVLPQYSFHPLCTYDLTYRLQVTLEAAGKQYSSEVVYQQSHPHKALWTLFTGDCRPSHGTALAFRFEDNRLVLLSSMICREAEQRIADRAKANYATLVARAMKEHRKVDVAELCTGIIRSRDRSISDFREYDGFLIDNADKPTRWSGLRFDDASPFKPQFRIVTAVAEAADISPQDNLDKIAPGILRTEFKSLDGRPQHLIPWSRSYSKSSYVAYQQ
jgi:hypothetical protein